MGKMNHIRKVTFTRNKMLIVVNGKECQFDLKKISKRLLKATPKERENYEISPGGYGIHWPLIDEDLSINALLDVRHDSSVKEFSNK